MIRKLMYALLGTCFLAGQNSFAEKNSIGSSIENNQDSHGSLLSNKYNYLPYLQVGGYRFFNLNTAKAATGGDMFVPLWQSPENLVFTHLRLFDRTGKPFEGNAHFGYRHLAPEREHLYGIYGAFDRKRTDFGNYFNQLTFGVEGWFRNLFIGGNYYQPIGETSRLIGLTDVTAELDRIQNNIWINRSNLYEKSMGGGDAEVGYELVKGLVGYIGGYYFSAKDTTSICGPKARFTYDWSLDNGKRIFGVFDKLGLETGVQKDNPRGTTYYLNANIRMGLLPSKDGNLQGAARHMADLVRRDVDIVASNSHQVTRDLYRNSDGSVFKIVGVESDQSGIINFTDLYNAAASNNVVVASGTINATDLINTTETINTPKTIILDRNIYIDIPEGRIAVQVTPPSKPAGTISGTAQEMAFLGITQEPTLTTTPIDEPSATTIDKQTSESSTHIRLRRDYSENLQDTQPLVVSLSGASLVISNKHISIPNLNQAKIVKKQAEAPNQVTKNTSTLPTTPDLQTQKQTEAPKQETKNTATLPTTLELQAQKEEPKPVIAQATLPITPQDNILPEVEPKIKNDAPLIRNLETFDTNPETKDNEQTLEIQQSTNTQSAAWGWLGHVGATLKTAAQNVFTRSAIPASATIKSIEQVTHSSDINVGTDGTNVPSIGRNLLSLGMERSVLPTHNLINNQNFGDMIDATLTRTTLPKPAIVLPIISSTKHKNSGIPSKVTNLVGTAFAKTALPTSQINKGLTESNLITSLGSAASYTGSAIKAAADTTFVRTALPTSSLIHSTTTKTIPMVHEQPVLAEKQEAVSTNWGVVDSLGAVFARTALPTSQINKGLAESNLIASIGSAASSTGSAIKAAADTIFVSSALLASNIILKTVKTAYLDISQTNTGVLQASSIILNVAWGTYNKMSFAANTLFSSTIFPGIVPAAKWVVDFLV